ncbi:MAG: twitching motility protein PilT [Candidatus Handelsmanbacteria bacterium RIFCSPLOWO2_12_FULL_64_10]|uniref:Twitching motility protein PilT n=1 Tax=Handelsmanbacteria sp. (strain RIFCSPLOWO2_12_FULL_64_10) TaxID=1817868 RepID=A0A1F6CL66_HANXR|nr:MAG: twitching motility protein PilT [Candidatus Handelsmanbacteria bacterium RIFCSPLOWO2_12_FULL_64_10]
MSDLVIVDTDILIDAGRDVNEAVACLQHIEQQSSPAISLITQMELMVGCSNKIELRKMERFLLRFQVIKLNEQISDVAIDLLRCYRLSHGLLLADGLIAASALSLDVPFITKNQRDYRFIKGLHLLAYPEPFPAKHSEP